MFYKQCLMSRRVHEGYEFHTAWIPEKYARMGKVLKIFDGTTGDWSDGWVVSDVYARQTEEFVLEHERDYKTQRETSDI